MSIDERLDRLTERHEALAQTLEIMAREQDDLRRTVRAQSENIQDLVRATADLLRIAERHEQRLDRLEG